MQPQDLGKYYYVGVSKRKIFKRFALVSGVYGIYQHFKTCNLL